MKKGGAMEKKFNIDDITKQLLQNAEENQENNSKTNEQISETIIKEKQDDTTLKIENSTDTQANTNDTNVPVDTNHTNTQTAKIASTSIEKSKSKYGKVFEKWSVSDIVFLAIVTTITLLSGAVMPLLINVPLFGIIQLGLSLQYGIFITIALLKVRKTGAMLFMSVISGIVLVFMNPIMFFVLVICALICEVLAILISKGFKTTFTCILTAILYIPLSLPFLYIYYSVMFPSAEVGSAVAAMRGGNVWVNLGMSLAVIAVSALGSLIGYFISKELSKFAFYKK